MSELHATDQSNCCRHLLGVALGVGAIVLVALEWFNGPFVDPRQAGSSRAG